jgi:hypothetical protein
MKSIPSPLFTELRSSNPRIATGWLVTRKDGAQYGFTTSDLEFVYGGITYTPANGFNPSAVVSKADASVDNIEMQVLLSDVITEEDLRGGVWNNAAVKVFWVCPFHPEWGVIPMRGGIFGEVVIKEGDFTVQLRALFEQLQLPFGYQYSLQCQAQLGDARCKVKLTVPTWQPNHTYKLGLGSDAGVGDIVQPTVPNGYWYVANCTTDVGAQGPRIPSLPGEGLSANDDMGPNDQTQTAAGPAQDNFSAALFTTPPVDPFGTSTSIHNCFRVHVVLVWQLTAQRSHSYYIDLQLTARCWHV